MTIFNDYIGICYNNKVHKSNKIITLALSQIYRYLMTAKINGGYDQAL